MRSPDRIDPFLAAFGELWKRHPDMRFGQLFMNLIRDELGGFPDPWGWEESQFLSRIETFEEDASARDERVMAELAEKLKNLPGGIEIIQRMKEELENDS